MELKFNTAAAERKLSPNAVRSFFAGLEDELLRWRVDELNTFRDTRLNGRPGLNRITGTTARSLVPMPAQKGREGFMFLPTIDGPNGDMPNPAYMQETGCVVTAKGGKLLAWPVMDGPASTQAGVSRYGNSPRNYPGKLFFFRVHTGNMFLAESLGRGGKKMRLVYHLAKSVTIPARLGFQSFATEALDRVKMRLVERKTRTLREMAV